MRLAILPLVLLVSLPLAAQPDTRSARVDLHLRAYLAPSDAEVLPRVPPLLAQNEALRQVELSRSGQGYWLEARFLFLDLSEYEAWREAEETQQMMMALQENPDGIHVSLSVGGLALAMRDKDE
ncbi:MAG: hypothetical protein AAGI52_05375 [Bacteroidota bacterium]